MSLTEGTKGGIYFWGIRSLGNVRGVNDSIINKVLSVFKKKGEKQHNIDNVIKVDK